MTFSSEWGHISVSVFVCVHTHVCVCIFVYLYVAAVSTSWSYSFATVQKRLFRDMTVDQTIHQTVSLPVFPLFLSFTLLPISLSIWPHGFTTTFSLVKQLKQLKQVTHPCETGTELVCSAAKNNSRSRIVHVSTWWLLQPLFVLEGYMMHVHMNLPFIQNIPLPFILFAYGSSEEIFGCQVFIFRYFRFIYYSIQ